MKLSGLFSLTLLLAVAMPPGIAGAQDSPPAGLPPTDLPLTLTPSTQPIQPPILEASKPLGDYPAASPTTRPVIDTPTLSESQIEKSLEDLASAEPDVRETARVVLLGMSRDQLPALREIVRSAAPIAPAQAAALRDIVAHVYLAGEPYDGENKGFMGVMLPRAPQFFQVQFQPGLPPAPLIPPQGGDDGATGDAADDASVGIGIQDCMPGFCGFRYLRPGDLVIAVQTGAPGAPDQFTRTSVGSAFSEEISHHLPGSPLTLRLIRQGRMIDVTLILSERPKVLSVELLEADVDKWRDERLKMAQDYWQSAFEPLLGPHIS